ncbi:MAG: hypothetical protein PHI14_00465 [Bacteroidales bacterium]|nr:hypothetical protein [Bacteroidales bacterium]
MKTYFVIIACLLSLQTFSQSLPQWLFSLPQKTDTYYYRVSSAEGLTEEIAEKKAFAKAIYESAFAIGISVDVSKLEETDSSMANISKYVEIPINMCCKYVEYLTTRRGYKVYVLCQVANDVNIRPEYKTFDCYLNKEVK